MPFGAPVIGAAQDHLEIEDIREDLVLMKDGSCCMILRTTAVNFGLLSEKEQDATIYAYAGLLNSLSFPMQVVIRSKRMDISFYLDQLIQQEKKQLNNTLKVQIQQYRTFIESLIKENNVLDKKFYVVIPFTSTELGVKSATGSLFGKRTLPLPKEQIISQAKTSLVPKRDHLIKQFARIGLKTEQMKTQQLIELFYYLYNPTEVGGPRLTQDVEEYTSPLVQPAIEKTQQQQQEKVSMPHSSISVSVEEAQEEQPAWQRVTKTEEKHQVQEIPTEKREKPKEEQKKEKKEPTFRAILEEKMRGETPQTPASTGAKQ